MNRSPVGQASQPAGSRGILAPWSARQNAARTARQHGINGYVPSLEPFSCIDGPPGSGKPRQKPFHFEWLRDGQMPLNELLIRVNRIAFREFTRDPDLSDAEFKRILEEEIFRKKNARASASKTAVTRASASPLGLPDAIANSQNPIGNLKSKIENPNGLVEDLLALQEAYFFEADWFRPSPLLNPIRLKERAQKENWPSERLNRYTQRIERMREIEQRYRGARSDVEHEMCRVAKHLLQKWDELRGRN